MTAAEQAIHSPTPAHPNESSLQGLSSALADDASRLDILEKAFDFRGDVTLTLADGATVAGYIFDRRRGPTVGDSYVRLMGAADDTKRRVGFAEIARIEFGKDAAHGKSFENWVKRYIEKKMKGEKASIESEVL